MVGAFEDGLLISIQGLSFCFRGGMQPALDGVDLAIDRGEFVVIAGPSGCGKSTLALGMGGYLFQQHDGEASGAVAVAGLDARRSPVYDVAEVVGLVQQNPEAQFCTLKVEDEVAFGLENRCLPPQEIRVRLSWALEAVGAAHLARRDLASLSGGEKQKVAIAAVLAARPQVLILDEPTSNLDPAATAQVFAIIARLRAEAGLTVIVIEHKLAYLRPHQPRLVAMEAGRIVYDGPMEGWQAPEPYAVQTDRILETQRNAEEQSTAEAAQGANAPPPDDQSHSCVHERAGEALGERSPSLCGSPRLPESGDGQLAAFSGQGTTPLVRMEGLAAGYGDAPVLQEVDLAVQPGEFVALMGGNGSGKTTLLLSLLGLLKPAQGRVQVLGEDTQRVPISQLARRVGLVFQNPDHQLFAESVWHEATFGPRNARLLDEETASRVKALLERSGLGERLEDHPYRLSYGQKRRLNLVSTLALGPQLILLDEVLIGQDPQNAAYLMGLVREQVARGAAAILAVHDPEVARRYATRLVFLSAGQVIVDAPPAEAFERLTALGWGAYTPLGPTPSPSLEGEGWGEGGGLSKSHLAPSRRSGPGVGAPPRPNPLPRGAAAPRGRGDGTVLPVAEDEPSRGPGAAPGAGPARLRIAYQPGHSFLHRLHPLVKLAWLLVGTAFVFVARNPWAVLGVAVLAFLAHLLARLRLGGRRGIRLFATMALFLAALQLVFVRQGPVLFRLGPLAPTVQGLEAAVYVSGRFLSVILQSYLFVLTTDPSDLAYALVRAGVPYRYGFALVTALRLVPVFEQEAQIVYNAQLARGVRYDVRSPRRLLTLGRQFFLPLLVSALGKADTLAISMEGRCFGKYPARTYLREARLGRADAVALAALLIALAAGFALAA